jgi:hypothetical protein
MEMTDHDLALGSETQFNTLRAEVDRTVEAIKSSTQLCVIGSNLVHLFFDWFRLAGRARFLAGVNKTAT